MALSLRKLALPLAAAALVAAPAAPASTGGAAAPAPTPSTAGGSGYGSAGGAVPAGTSAPAGSRNVGGVRAGDRRVEARIEARRRAVAKRRAAAKRKQLAKQRALAKRRALERRRAAAKRREAAEREARARRSNGYRFPLLGAYTMPPGGAFGVSRPGHKHQGQDLSAAMGTPVVAPHAGTVTTVAYQASAAGHYVVLDGAGEDRSYVFMHLRTGSIRVRVGQTVSAGQRLAEVGSTGRSTGPHLHFEIWVGGPWQGGGHPVDPLPYLRSWRR